MPASSPGLLPYFTPVASTVEANNTGRRWQPRKRGKRGGSLVRFRRRVNRSPLPSLILSNLNSITNKRCELSSLICSQRDYKDAAALCFTETKLGPQHSDSSLQFDGYTLFRGDRTSASNKDGGGGVCAYINQRWASDCRALSHTCSPELETLTVHCRPFYLPRELSAIILVLTYIPPKVSAPAAKRQIADHILEVELSHPDAFVILLGDFNHIALNKVLPRYKPQIDIPTRAHNTLDQCYCKIPNAFHAARRAPVGESDHDTILLVP